MKYLVTGIFVLSLCGVIFAVYYKSTWRPPLPEPVGEVGTFSLQNQDGETIDQSYFHGKVVVMDLIFTRCKTICPALSAQMLKLQKILGRYDQFHLLSVSVDPEYDTPERLKAFGQSHGANFAKWTFLTGPLENVRTFIDEEARIGFPVEPMGHSDKFVLIDQRGKIRGTYSLNDKDEMIRLQNAAFYLIRHPRAAMKVSTK